MSRRRRDREALPERLAAALTGWYARAAHDLPWRRRRTGYRALVAEMMLQQTQVARVAERYVAFLKRFPTVASLAGASEQEVLAEWQGFGYYRRARHLHAAARMIERDFGGRVPRDAATLRRLPGVGRYTAGAIASIVYGESVPIVDGNVRRVLARLAGDAKYDDAKAWADAAALVERAAKPGIVNEALMELGATVCTPRGPRCESCPLAGACVARKRGIQDRVPAPKTRAARRSVHHHSVVVVRSGRVLMEQRGDSGLWSGMWQAPTVEADERLPEHEIAERLAVPVIAMDACGSFVHETTHRRVHFHVYRATSRARRGVWQSVVRMGDLPLSNAQKRVLALAVE